jgi:hypothetical protein
MDKLQNIKYYLTKGGFSEIYRERWDIWRMRPDSEQQLVRVGTHEVILKGLENVESVNQKWFEEVCDLNMTF